MSVQEPIDGARTGNVFLRIWWMFGPMVIGLVAFMLASEPPWRFSSMDAVFWMIVASVVGARVIDVTRFGGLRADESPTTPAHLLRYGTTVTALAVIAWVAARAVEI